MTTNNLQLNISFQQLVDMIKKLPADDRIKLSEYIWDESMEIPIEHQELVHQRILKSKENPDSLLDWDTVSKSL